MPSVKGLISWGWFSLHHTSRVDALKTSYNDSLVTLIIAESAPLVEESKHDAIYDGSLIQLRELSVVEDVGICLILVWPAEMLGIDCWWSIRLSTCLLQESSELRIGQMCHLISGDKLRDWSWSSHGRPARSCPELLGTFVLVDSSHQSQSLLEFGALWTLFFIPLESISIVLVLQNGFQNAVIVAAPRLAVCSRHSSMHISRHGSSSPWVAAASMLIHILILYLWIH